MVDLTTLYTLLYIYIRTSVRGFIIKVPLNTLLYINQFGEYPLVNYIIIYTYIYIYIYICVCVCVCVCVWRNHYKNVFFLNEESAQFYVKKKCNFQLKKMQ